MRRRDASCASLSTVGAETKTGIFMSGIIPPTLFYDQAWLASAGHGSLLSLPALVVLAREQEDRGGHQDAHHQQAHQAQQDKELRAEDRHLQGSLDQNTTQL